MGAEGDSYFGEVLERRFWSGGFSPEGEPFAGPEQNRRGPGPRLPHEPSDCASASSRSAFRQLLPLEVRRTPALDRASPGGHGGGRGAAPGAEDFRYRGRSSLRGQNHSQPFVRQFASMSGASICSKCRVLLVTSTAPSARAWAAIIMSNSPIKRPAVTS